MAVMAEPAQYCRARAFVNRRLASRPARIAKCCEHGDTGWTPRASRKRARARRRVRAVRGRRGGRADYAGGAATAAATISSNALLIRRGLAVPSPRVIDFGDVEQLGEINPSPTARTPTNQDGSGGAGAAHAISTDTRSAAPGLARVHSTRPGSDAVRTKIVGLARPLILIANHARVRAGMPAFALVRRRRSQRPENSKRCLFPAMREILRLPPYRLDDKADRAETGPAALRVDRVDGHEEEPHGEPCCERATDGTPRNQMSRVMRL